MLRFMPPTSATINLIPWFAIMLCLQLIALASLMVTPAYSEALFEKGKDYFFFNQAYHRTELNSGLENSTHKFSSRFQLALSDQPEVDKDSSGNNENADEKKKSVEPITFKIPIWGEKVREMGFDLPLPFGAGVNFTLMNQGLDIQELRVGVGSESTEPSGISFSDARARDKAATMRLDAWLLPFVNVYGLFGYINGNAQLDVNIPGLSIGPVPVIPEFTLPVDEDYEGTTFGGGITLAGGYKSFFGSVDANYTHSEIDVVDGEIKTLTISPRLGLLFDPSYIPGSFAIWIGAMYMRYKQEISDSINLADIDPRLPAVDLKYDLDLENEEPWNFLFGGQWEITKRWQIMVEGGIGERKQLITGVFFRF
jgi:hypothetical protein